MKLIEALIGIAGGVAAVAGYNKLIDKKDKNPEAVTESSTDTTTTAETIGTTEEETTEENTEEE